MLPTKIVQIGTSGIYMDCDRVTANIQQWIEKTPYEIKRQQIESFATTGILVLAGLIFALALTEK